MKILPLIILFILSSFVFADEMVIPLSCWPKDLKEEFEKTGRKLDLSAIDRTENSWGYILNEGSKYSIFTYRSATPEDFQVIQYVVSKVETKKRK